jgi:hypothetical protein
MPKTIIIPLLTKNNFSIHLYHKFGSLKIYNLLECGFNLGFLFNVTGRILFYGKVSDKDYYSDS